MKIRQGFVSNSSSSSYILALARIQDLEKYNAWKIECKQSDNVFAMTTSSIKERKRYNIDIHNGILTASNFATDVSLKIDTNLEEVFFITCITGNEDDIDFYNKVTEKIDYDISESYFVDTSFEELIKLIHNPEKAGLKDLILKYGAGRNG